MNTSINDFPDRVCNLVLISKLLIKERPLFMAKLLSHHVIVFILCALSNIACLLA